MKKVLALLVLALLCIQCQTETVLEPDSQNLTISNTLDTTKAYQPNVTLDQSLNGVYHGVIAAKTGIDSRKIWINHNNNERFSAKIEDENGGFIYLQQKKELSNVKNSVLFYSSQASFKVTTTNNGVAFSDAEIGGNPYFIHAPKQTTQRMTFPFTGSYAVDGGAANGTWTIFADTSQPDPNGAFFEGFAMADVVVTFGSNMYIDSSHEVGPYPCEGVPNWVPTVRIQEFFDNENMVSIFVNEIFVQPQTSDFGGVTNWKIFQAGGVSYFDENCDPIEDPESGLFNWTNPNTGVIKTGVIFLNQ